MTDGEVGNDLDIIAEVQKNANARVFAFGIGSSVNHFLLDNIARYGRGEVEYVGLHDDGSAAARRFHERVRNPLLTDISIDWGGLPVTDVLPTSIPDLFAAKPVVISGRYSTANGVIRLKGKMAGRDFAREIRVSLPASQPENDVLETLWARRQVADLMSRDFGGLQRGSAREDLKQQITKLGLDFRLMTPFTSFVAVEEKTITEGGVARRVEVPVEMPEGMSYQGVFGTRMEMDRRAMNAPMAVPVMSGYVGGVAGGGAMGGIVGGRTQGQQGASSIDMVRKAAPPPPPTQATPAPQPTLAKLDAAIAAVIRRAKNGARPSVDEARFVFGDQAYVRVTLSDASPTSIEQLRKAGLVITKTEGNVIAGHVALSSLEALSKLPIVTWIAPRP
jgi:Ca-activated chloride channel family protein